MIRFPCKCGHKFELPDERSGGLEQCPVCSRLNDVPTLSDLTNLSEDGTFLIEEPVGPVDQITVGHLHEAFAPGTVDLYGNERDLRRVAIEPMAVAVDPIAPARVAPRYDPVTGELIRALEVSNDEVLEALPVEEDGSLDAVTVAARQQKGAMATARPKSLRYSTDAHRKSVTPATALVELLMPANVTVLFVIFLATYAAGMFGWLLSVGSTYVHFYLQVLNVPLWLLLAHYGGVIEDLGPDGMDELPRPLRFGELVGDIFNPLLHVVVALAICYLPAMLMLSPKIDLPLAFREMAVLLLGGIGTALFPAVLITTVTGVTFANLRPDRVLAVAVAGGADYVLSLGALVISMILTAGAFMVPVVPMSSPWFKAVSVLHQYYVVLPLALAAVYMTHYFCWLLGMMYREHHAEYPWLLQRHVRTPKVSSTPVRHV